MASQPLTIVMYHYVRDLARTRYPAIKGLDVGAFRAQLDFIRRQYHVITPADLVQAVVERHETGSWDLPPNSLLLTFDDGYADHFEHVFPLLDEANLQACFFVPVLAVAEGRVLDVNKIHFVLAAVSDTNRLLGDVVAAIDAARAEFDVEPQAILYARLARASRWDPPDIVFIKRALQTALPAALRARIVDALFHQYVSCDEPGFAAELYMNRAQLGALIDRGMYIGCHGYAHVRLGHLTPEEQAFEIDQSLAFVASLGTSTDAWIMCYPYGDTNQSLTELLRRRKCAAGLTTRVAVATSDDDPLLLPRIDTNDIPVPAVLGH